jgi:hypothetical protein
MVHPTAYLGEVLETRLRRSHHATVIVRWQLAAINAVAVVHLLVLVPATLLLCLLLEQRSDAYTTSLRSEVTTEGISTGKPSPATPATVILEHSTADELLLPGVETLMSLSIMLAGKRFSANTAYKRTLVGMSTQMRTKIISSSESFRTKRTLESCWVLLGALGTRAIANLGRSRWVCQIQDVITVRNV